MRDAKVPGMSLIGEYLWIIHEPYVGDPSDAPATSRLDSSGNQSNAVGRSRSCST